MSGKNIKISSDGFNVSPDGKVEIIATESNNVNSAMLTVKTPDTGASSKIMPSLVWIENQEGLARIGTFGWPILHLKNRKNGHFITLQATNSNNPEIKLQGINNTAISSENITTPLLIQTSLKSKKKNIKKIKINAVSLIKNADICSYRLKGEKGKKKKHIGLVIGDGYNCPEEVITENRQGIEQYSMTTIAWKAIQEQQEQIEILQEEVKRLKEVK